MSAPEQPGSEELGSSARLLKRAFTRQAKRESLPGIGGRSKPPVELDEVVLNGVRPEAEVRALETDGRAAARMNARLSRVQEGDRSADVKVHGRKRIKVYAVVRPVPDPGSLGRALRRIAQVQVAS